MRRMLSHESGLVGDPPGTDWSTPTVYESRSAPTSPEPPNPRIPPNTQQKYSNIAYQLLGEIVRA